MIRSGTRSPAVTLTLALFLSALLFLAPTTAFARDTAPPDLDRSPERTTTALIDAARADGRLSFEESILMKAWSLYAPNRLPEEYRGSVPEKCGTPTALEIEAALPDLPQAVSGEIRDTRIRPTNQTYIDTEHFRIHYDTTGGATILDWPDTSYRDAIMVSVELSWDLEVDGLGFRPPPSDGSDPGDHGGNGLYDVYVQDLGTTYYGYAQATYLQPGGPPQDASSYVVIDNDYLGFGYPDPQDPMKVTVAHEFNHSCQFAHNVYQESWYMECSAVWAEDIVYDSINDYYFYIPYYLNSPYRSIEYEDIAMYGSTVWNHYLAHQFGNNIVPDVWYDLESTDDALAGLDSHLSGLGSGLEDEFLGCATWNWFTGSRDDGSHYEEGASWGLAAAQRTYSSYPIVGGAPPDSNPDYRPDHIGTNYILFNNTGGPDDQLEVSYDGPAPASIPNRVFFNTKTLANATAEYGELSLNGFGNGNMLVSGWDGLNQVCMVVVNVSRTANGMDYTYDVDRSSPVEGIFYASFVEPMSVIMRWSIASLTGIDGIELRRATSEGGDFTPITAELLAPESVAFFTDTDVRPGDELWYRIVLVMDDGTEDTIGEGLAHVTVDGTLGISLSRPMPNPFTDATELEFATPLDGERAVIRIYDLRGRLVRTLLDEASAYGRHVARWDGTDDSGHSVASGVYFCSLEQGGAYLTQKLMFLK